MSSAYPASSSSGAVLAPPAVVRAGLPLGAVVAMSCLAQFMVVLDSAIVTLALPQMRAGLGLSASEQQWVLSGYLITLGGFLLLAARAGDLFGRKRLFLFGAAVFTAASLAGGLATDPAMLLAARVVQGAGAAALAPTSLSLITATHADEQRRRRALALWSIMGGLAGVTGIVLGGVLTAELSWRWVLFINVPLGVALLAAALAALAPAPRPARAARTRLDVAGAVTATLGIGALTYGLSQASANGWGSPGVVTGLVCAGVLLAAFGAVEATGSRPLIPPALFRLRGLSAGNLLMLCMGATMTAAFFFLSLYLQEALGYSALRAGLAMLPTTVATTSRSASTRASWPPPPCSRCAFPRAEMGDSGTRHGPRCPARPRDCPSGRPGAPVRGGPAGRAAADWERTPDPFGLRLFSGGPWGMTGGREGSAVVMPDGDGPPNRRGRPLRLTTRRRAYFAMMGTCLVLIVLAWTLIWRYSVTAAVVMSAVALVIPPFAAVVANSGPANRQ
jgi:MFS family permease